MTKYSFRRRALTLFASASALGFALGCNSSPLFNHTHAQGADAASSERCPLSFPNQKLCASITWVKAPTQDEPGEFTLKFLDPSDDDSRKAVALPPEHTAFVLLWMSSMGHGSSPVKIAPAQAADGAPIPGVYRVTDVFFVMNGPWQIIVQIKKDGLVIEQAELNVQVPIPAPTPAPQNPPEPAPESTPTPTPAPTPAPVTPPKIDCALRLPNHKLCASITWVKKPKDDEEVGEFTLRFWDEAKGTEHGPYVSPEATVLAVLWMPDHGHGSTPTKVAAAQDPSGAQIPGVYQVTNVHFVMTGAWQILIQLRKNGQVIEQETYELEI